MIKTSRALYTSIMAAHVAEVTKKDREESIAIYKQGGHPAEYIEERIAVGEANRLAAAHWNLPDVVFTDAYTPEQCQSLVVTHELTRIATFIEQAMLYVFLHYREPGWAIDKQFDIAYNSKIEYVSHKAFSQMLSFEERDRLEVAIKDIMERAKHSAKKGQGYPDLCPNTPGLTDDPIPDRRDEMIAMFKLKLHAALDAMWDSFERSQ